MGKLTDNINDKAKSINRLTAEKLYNQIKSAFSDKHEFIVLSQEDLSGINMEYYDLAQRRLEKFGYKYLGDIEDVHLRNSNLGSRTIERIMKSRDSRVFVTIHCSTLKGFIARIRGKKQICNIVFYSEFIDGDYIITAATSDSIKFSRPNTIDIVRRPRETSLGSLLSEHYRRLDRETVSIYGLRNVIDSKLRYHICLFRHRKELGFNLTEDEKHRFKISDGVAKELNEIALLNK